MPAPPHRTVVLVHGAWHGAWCWAALQAELDRRGIASYALDLPGHGVSTLPLGDLRGDAQHVADALATVDDDVLLVGHSYGGAVISEAASHATNVAHLAYLTAFVLDAGESLLGYAGTLPPVPTAISSAMSLRDDGSTVLIGDAVFDALYGCCPRPAAQAAVARLGPQPGATFQQPVTAPAWRTIPSTYVRCTLDHTIDITHQDAMAARCGEIVSLDTDHSPFLSRTVETADVLERLARR